MPPGQYDVFLSHCGLDKPVVEAIAGHLVQEGISPFLDRWSLVPGEPWQEAIEEALEHSDHCAVFVGPGGLGPWENEEMRVALERRARDPRFRVIPILLPGSDPQHTDRMPPFLRRLTWVDLRAGAGDSRSLRPLVAAIRGMAPGPSLQARPVLDTGIIHPLPPAPRFAGRAAELRALSDVWASDQVSLCALLGIGGCGKTALTAEFIRALIRGEPAVAGTPPLPAPDAVFVWSFYVDQDIGAFLEQCHRYVSGDGAPDGRSATAVYRLVDALAGGRRTLLVLDGLERVQREHSDSRHRFGELEDSLLRQFVRRIASGLGRTKCLVTSRFPLADVDVWSGRGYRHLDVDRMSEDDALAIVAQHLPRAGSSEAGKLVQEYGSHALTLDHICGYVREFCGGEIAAAFELPQPTVAGATREERKLARVLQAYEGSLTPAELDLLSRVALFRFGTSLETLCTLFGASPAGVGGSLAGLDATGFRLLAKRLVDLHLLLPEGSDKLTAHPAVRDYFARRVLEPERIHSAVETHFSTLASRPGAEEPEDRATLDLLEEVIYHSLAAGREAEAADVYRSKMGGVRNLGYTLGEYARGLRILRSFKQCPSLVDLATYLRALGELRESLALVDQLPARERFAILALAGRLPEVEAHARQDFELSTLHQAMLLGGKTRREPNFRLFANHRTSTLHPHLAFYYGARVGTMVSNLGSYKEQTVRCSLSLAEIERQAGHLDAARKLLQGSDGWIAQSGAQELICLRHLTSARIARSAGELSAAAAAIREGLHVARHCGLVLYHADLLLEQARCALRTGDPELAARAARHALNGTPRHSEAPALHDDLPEDELAMIGAAHPLCGYRWAVGDGLALLGEALVRRGEIEEGVGTLRRALEVQEEVGDSRREKVAGLLALFGPDPYER